MTTMTIPQALELAVQQHRSGNLPAAEQIYRQILSQNASQPQALYLLGTIALQVGKLDEAADLIGRAIELMPTNADFHTNMGEVRRAQNRIEEAEGHFKTALELNGNSAVAINNLGVLRQNQGRWDEALELHQKAAGMDPNMAMAHLHAGQVLKRMGKIEEALTAHDRARQLEPNNPDVLFLMGSLALENGRPELALHLFSGAIKLKPADTIIACSLGFALNALRKFDEAIALANQIIAIRPTWIAGHYLLALAHGEKGEDEKAYEIGKRALEIEPENLDAMMMMSSVAHQIGKEEESLEYSRQVIAQRPDVGASHWNRAIVLLGLGKFQEGWKEFEWRLKSEQQAHLRRPDLKGSQWEPGEDIAGKTLLLHCEGGFGDAIQFIRYLPMVKEKGADVILECQKELKELFSRLEGVNGLYARGEQLPVFDLHCPLQGLPLRLGTNSIEEIPAGIPYLSADPILVEKWEEKMAALGEGLKVGLVWAGSGNPADRRTRSLEAFAPLGKIEGVQFLSMQKGSEAAEAKQPPQGMKIADFSPELTDFAQAAALVENLDLVICVDTAAAHLAGALGKEVWVLLPACPDFRWLLEREDSPWYPGVMRLFRKKHTEGWGGVMERVATALQDRVK